MIPLRMNAEPQHRSRIERLSASLEAFRRRALPGEAQDLGWAPFWSLLYLGFLFMTWGDPPSVWLRPTLVSIAIFLPVYFRCYWMRDWKQLTHLSDEALIGQLPKVTLFCRVNPQQKLRVILALKRLGHVVGYLGDGINDAPALHAADVGISVDDAADVARAAADLILLEHDLSVVLRAVVQGRRAVRNVAKYVFMGSSSNFGNMLSMALAAVLLPFLPMLPIQVLLNNLIYDLSQTALPFDRVDPEATATPAKWDNRAVERFMLVFGPLSSVFDLATFYVLFRLFDAGEALFQTGWFVESLVTQILVVFAIRTRRPLFGSRPHPLLAGSALGLAALALILPFTPVGAWFGLVPLPAQFFFYLAAAVAAYLLLVEIAKRFFYRRHPAA